MKNKGITLIALVITIIVLLILASITINLTVGNQGVITRAQQATKQTELRSIEERAKLVKADLDIDSLSGNFKAFIEKNVLLSKLQEKFEGSTRSGDIITTSNKKYDIVVDNDLNITVIEHTKSSGGGITLVYDLIEDENTSAVGLKVRPIIDEIGEIPTEDELYQKAQEAINNLPADETQRNEAIDKIFIEFINIMIKSERIEDMVITDLNQALQLFMGGMGSEESYPSFKAFYEAKMSKLGSFDEFVFQMQYAIEKYKYESEYLKMVTIECSNGKSHSTRNSEYATFNITRNGKYTITAEDEKGNTGKIQVEITQVIEEKFSEIYEETTQITSADGQKVWIPKGFAVGISDTVNKVSKGLVITDNVDKDGYSIGNEFVWVPVDSSKFQRAEGYTEGGKSTYLSKSKCTEPYVEDGYLTEENEYKEMVTSVKSNGGFYIGRYEAGKDSAGNLVVQIGVDVYNIGWNASESNALNDDTGGAVEKARNFKNGKAYADSVTSTLIYGIQWDATMQFFDNRYIDGIPEEDIANSYVSNSTGKGNYDESGQYNGTIEQTGSSPEYSIKNIYDMAGNAYEWTMEAFYLGTRVIRGGSYDVSGSYEPASYRGNNFSSSSVDESGFRIALYL